MIIHSWGTPRTLTTALMYSFAQREDCDVFDEPLYADYLVRNPKQTRPYRESLLATMDNDGNSVLERILFNATESGRIQYLKHICKFHRNDLDTELLFTPTSVHILLVRDPLSVIRSWSRNNDIGVVPTCDVDDVGFVDAMRVYHHIKKHTGKAPIVVDTDILRDYPSEVLQELCLAIGIPFDNKMLTWPAGPKAYDGLWASHWYSGVHKSTCFAPKSNYDYQTDSNPIKSKIKNIDLIDQTDGEPLNMKQIDVYRDCFPYYETLRRYAIGRHPINPDSSTITKNRLYIPLTTKLKLQYDKNHIQNHNQNQNQNHVIDHGVSVSTMELSHPENADVLIWLGDRLVPREAAKVSVFDSAVQGGDAVWEGMRVYRRPNGESVIFKMKEHLDRLFDSAKAMGFQLSGDREEGLIPTREFVENALRKTLAANGMFDNAHMRVTLSRGPKITSSMNPLFNIFGSLLMIVPEWKPVGGAATYDNEKGVDLITATNRRNPPSCVDSKIHHCNLINNILPKIQANLANAADAVMLDLDGFVAETNATNIFMVKNGKLITPDSTACLPGITRNTIIVLGPKLGIQTYETKISLAELHTADEVFTTGTMGELTPVRAIDGRIIGTGKKSDRKVTNILQEAYKALTNGELKI
jgi:protein-lysine N-methyltransferase EEF2KMT